MRDKGRGSAPRATSPLGVDTGVNRPVKWSHGDLTFLGSHLFSGDPPSPQKGGAYWQRGEAPLDCRHRAREGGLKMQKKWRVRERSEWIPLFLHFLAGRQRRWRWGGGEGDPARSAGAFTLLVRNTPLDLCSTVCIIIPKRSLRGPQRTKHVGK